jgi:hypothetical protein
MHARGGEGRWMEHVEQAASSIDPIPAQLCLHCQSTFAFGGRGRWKLTTLSYYRREGYGPS